MATMRFTICDGPSKYDLMLALFERKKVNFSVAVYGVRRSFVGHIAEIKAEPGTSREDWLFTAFLCMADRMIGVTEEVKGYYSVRTRSGWVDLFTGL